MDEEAEPNEFLVSLPQIKYSQKHTECVDHMLMVEVEQWKIEGGRKNKGMTNVGLLKKGQLVFNIFLRV